MDELVHKVAGIFADRAGLEKARETLLAEGFSADQMHVIEPERAPVGDADSGDRARQALRHVGTGALAGVVGGIVAGVGASLVVAAPVAAVLAAAGIGALAGSAFGGVVSALVDDEDFYTIVREAQATDHYALVVAVNDEKESLSVQDVLGRMAVEAIDQQGGTHSEAGTSPP
jgi:hypothetical protein